MPDHTPTLASVWDHGMCDGLDVAAGLVEAAMAPLDHGSEGRHILVALLTVLREAQLEIQLEPT